MEFTPDDWRRLEGMRRIFLDRREAAPYWRAARDLELYDATFGRRIAWKWEAVLAELKERNFLPPPGPVLDWGCGSGVAARTWLGAFPAAEVALYDRSPLAVEFARSRVREEFPSARLVEEADPALLLVSHVLGEMRDPSPLVDLARRCRAVVWVEPGEHDTSRKLGAIRDALRGDFAVVAPCPHGAPCGVLAEGMERHWCHFFARAPAEAFHSREWAEFSRRLGIDLRSLPYAFVALSKNAAGSAPEFRMLGRPRVEKARLRYWACGAGQVTERILLKREDPELFRRLRGKE